jgi:hypothetical protein
LKFKLVYATPFDFIERTSNILYDHEQWNLLKPKIVKLVCLAISGTDISSKYSYSELVGASVYLAIKISGQNGESDLKISKELFQNLLKTFKIVRP